MSCACACAPCAPPHLGACAYAGRRRALSREWRPRSTGASSLSSESSCGASCRVSDCRCLLKEASFMPCS
eukprot:scaffold5298_cov67-Phaeocystis_antarctica.AAC.5